MIEEDVFDRIYIYREKKRNGNSEKKTYGDVFDRRTLMAFYKLLKKTIEYVEFPISSGKEAIVFRAMGKDGSLLAVKVYLISRLNYKGLSKFVDGDERFANIHKTKDNIVFLWAKKEFKNLQTYYNKGVRVPAPVKVWKNIVVMKYVGDVEHPAPLLKDSIEKLKKEIIFEIIEEMKKMFKAKLIHGDLSEYNMLYWGGAPWIIDVGQAVPWTHPLAYELLQRDIRNVVNFAKKLGLMLSTDYLNKEIGVK